MVGRYITKFLEPYEAVGVYFYGPTIFFSIMEPYISLGIDLGYSNECWKEADQVDYMGGLIHLDHFLALMRFLRKYGKAYIYLTGETAEDPETGMEVPAGKIVAISEGGKIKIPISSVTSEFCIWEITPPHSYEFAINNAGSMMYLVDKRNALKYIIKNCLLYTSPSPRDRG